MSLLAAAIATCVPVGDKHEVPWSQEILSFKVASRPVHAANTGADRSEWSITVELSNRSLDTVVFLDPICMGDTVRFFHNGKLLDTSAAYNPIKNESISFAKTICIRPGGNMELGMPFSVIDGMLDYGPLAVASVLSRK